MGTVIQSRLDADSVTIWPAGTSGDKASPGSTFTAPTAAGSGAMYVPDNRGITAFVTIVGAAGSFTLDVHAWDPKQAAYFLVAQYPSITTGLARDIELGAYEYIYLGVSSRAGTVTSYNITARGISAV